MGRPLVALVFSQCDLFLDYKRRTKYLCHIQSTFNFFIFYLKFTSCLARKLALKKIIDHSLVVSSCAFPVLNGMEYKVHYEPTCIVNIKFMSVTTVAKSFYFVINQILVTSKK